MAASPPILTPASRPTGPPRHVPKRAPATGYIALVDMSLAYSPFLPLVIYEEPLFLQS